MSRLPAYFVFGYTPLEIETVARQIANYAGAPLNPEGMKAVLVILDQPFLWALPSLKGAAAKLCDLKASHTL